MTRRICFFISIGGSVTLGPCSPSRSVSSTRPIGCAGFASGPSRFQSWIRSAGRASLPFIKPIKPMIGALPNAVNQPPALSGAICPIKQLWAIVAIYS